MTGSNIYDTFTGITMVNQIFLSYLAGRWHKYMYLFSTGTSPSARYKQSGLTPATHFREI